MSSDGGVEPQWARDGSELFYQSGRKLMDADTNDPVNIGNPHEVTIEEIARTIIELVGSTSKIVYRPLPRGAPGPRTPVLYRSEP